MLHQLLTLRISSIKIATLGNTPEQIFENLQTALPAIVSRIKDGWDNIQRLDIKTNSSTSLPIWTCQLGDVAGGRWDIPASELERKKSSKRAATADKGKDDGDDSEEEWGGIKEDDDVPMSKEEPKLKKRKVDSDSDEGHDEGDEGEWEDESEDAEPEPPAKAKKSKSSEAPPAKGKKDKAVKSSKKEVAPPPSKPSKKVTFSSALSYHLIFLDLPPHSLTLENGEEDKCTWYVAVHHALAVSIRSLILLSYCDKIGEKGPRRS
jgi:ribosome biogenesis protein UTP30